MCVLIALERPSRKKSDQACRSLGLRDDLDQLIVGVGWNNRIADDADAWLRVARPRAGCQAARWYRWHCL